ncbi:MAG: pteridine-dependent deoxygenase [Xanthomonadales bacterium]|nr:pteridine-dependent deoxygenase [Xanthomonadales bacterium]MCE7930999.1 pteridine-dependent deoxygenase [Xanthomonadales bacterium PRO6]
MRDPPRPDRRWLVDLASEPAADAFCSWNLGVRGAGTASFELPMPALDTCVESWRSQGRLRGGQLGAARFAGDDELMIGELILSERDFGGIGTTTHEAYRRLLDYVPGSGYPYVLRIWSYLARINDGDGDAERYRQFCVGRQLALERAWFEADPAATVIGLPDRSHKLRLLWLAAKTPGRMLDNPRQLNPRQYPPEYGPEPPRFSRAALWQCSRGGALLISGTASVVGHSSRHPGQIGAQLAETKRNLDSLLRVANEATGIDSQWGEGTVLRAYVRHENHFTLAEDFLREHFPGAACAVLQGEVCRRELLCEIEGVHHF